MFCEACGTQLQPAQHFCSTCGKAISSAPAATVGVTAGGRVRQHIQVLGIFWLVLFLFAAANAFLLSLERGSYAAPLFVRPVIAIIALLISGKGLLGVVAGLGLLKRARWARALVLFIAFLSLFELPFGTALAIYTLWVLLSPNADQQYRTLAAGG
jgi:phage shock protein PspC (stress-responsive transcriptional regulator)